MLFEAAGILYNLMSIEECKKVMLQRNAIQLIFEIASCNYTPVRHICSACLHMAPGECDDSFVILMFLFLCI